MPETFDEGWEFYSPDPEIADLFVEKRPASKVYTDHRRFVYCFEGSRNMEEGRFFSGISFDKITFCPNLLAWGNSSIPLSGIRESFQRRLLSIPQPQRCDWMIEQVRNAWSLLPQKKREIVASIVAWNPSLQTEKRIGRPVAATTSIARRFGINSSTAYRAAVSASWFLVSRLADSRDIPLCACGCGQPVSFAYVTNSKLGYKLGHPMKFVCGHNLRERRNVTSKREEVMPFEKRSPVNM